MSNTLSTFFVAPRALALAGDRVQRVSELACEFGLAPEAACSFVTELIGQGLLSAVPAEAHPQPPQRRRLLESESEESEAEEMEEAKSPGKMHVRLLRGKVAGQVAYLLPTLYWGEEDVERRSVREGVWYYTLADLEQAGAMEACEKERKLMRFLFEGTDTSCPMLAKSNHTDSWHDGVVPIQSENALPALPRRSRRPSRSTRSSAAPEPWVWFLAQEVAFYDCNDGNIVAVANACPSFARARMRLRACDLLEALLQRGWGERAGEWRSFFHDPELKYGEVRVMPLDLRVKGPCGACGQTKALSYKMHASSAHFKADMQCLGSYCAALLECAVPLAAFGLHNQGEMEAMRQRICEAAALMQDE